MEFIQSLEEKNEDQDYDQEIEYLREEFGDQTDKESSAEERELLSHIFQNINESEDIESHSDEEKDDESEFGPYKWTQDGTQESQGKEADYASVIATIGDSDYLNDPLI